MQANPAYVSKKNLSEHVWQTSVEVQFAQLLTHAVHEVADSQKNEGMHTVQAVAIY